MAKKPRTPPPPRPVQAPQRRDTPSAGGRTLDRRLLLWGGGAAVAIAVVVVLAVILGGGGSSKPKAIDWSAVPNLHTGPPPWDNGNAYLADRLQPLGLGQLGQEGSVIHIHQHLDVYFNGKHVAVPALVGYPGPFITELHTHDASGMLHVESPVKKSFYLGQFFGEWGVRLTSRCLGGFCGKLSWWLDGKKQTGNPALLKLQPHQEIAIVYGRPPASVPNQYVFPPGS